MKEGQTQEPVKIFIADFKNKLLREKVRMIQPDFKDYDQGIDYHNATIDYNNHLIYLKQYPATWLTPEMDGKELIEGKDFFVHMKDTVQLFPLPQEPVGEMVNKIECLIGYLQAWQKGNHIPLELNDVIQEAKDWVNNICGPVDRCAEWSYEYSGRTGDTEVNRLIKERIASMCAFAKKNGKEPNCNILYGYEIGFKDGYYTPPPAPIKKEGEDEIIKQVGYIKINAEKINEHTWKVYKEQILLHIEEIEATYSPPSPGGIDVQALAKQKAKEKYPGEMNMRGYKINAQKNNQEKFIEGFKAGYSASLPQSSTEEEKELWEEVSKIVIKHYTSYNYTDQDSNELQSKFKISKR